MAALTDSSFNGTRAAPTVATTGAPTSAPHSSNAHKSAVDVNVCSANSTGDISGLSEGSRNDHVGHIDDDDDDKLPLHLSGAPPHQKPDIHVNSDASKSSSRCASAPSTPMVEKPTFVEEDPLPPSPAELPRIKSFRQHRKNACSIDSVPKQTIMKALVSRPPPTSNLSITASIQEMLQANEEKKSIKSPPTPAGLAGIKPRRLSQALTDLKLDANTIAANKLAALASPCFFHSRFDDAVNIDRVLEEIQDDEWLSHSRLMQTATGVREVSKQLQRRPIKRAVRNVMIVTKARDNELVYLTRELAEWLLSTPRYGSEVGVNVYVDAKLQRSRRFDADGLVAKDSRFNAMLRYWTPDLCWTNPEKFDLVLTLGGDGTVLYTSWLFQRIVPPLLSFSLGSLGFLTNFEFSAYREHLTRIMGDAGMRINLRMRFTCTVYRSSQPRPSTSSSAGVGASVAPAPAPAAGSSMDSIEAEQFEVLNELVIDRGPSPYVSQLELYGDNTLLTVIQADGCIFSTPTGSTAYSLSAGGSLVHPDIPAILLTPICPHTLSFRPMILSDSMLLRVAVPKGSRATAYCAFDGKGRVELRPGDFVEMAASQYPFPTVVSGGMEWFDSISRTLRWNTRGATQKAWTGEAGADADGGAKDTGFDIDIDDDNDPGRDSGYSAEGSSTGGTTSPPRRNTLGQIV